MLWNSYCGTSIQSKKNCKFVIQERKKIFERTADNNKNRNKVMLKVV